MRTISIISRHNIIILPVVSATLLFFTISLFVAHEFSELYLFYALLGTLIIFWSFVVVSSNFQRYLAHISVTSYSLMMIISVVLLVASHFNPPVNEAIVEYTGYNSYALFLVYCVHMCLDSRTRVVDCEIIFEH